MIAPDEYTATLSDADREREQERYAATGLARSDLVARLEAAQHALYAAMQCCRDLDGMYDIEYTEGSLGRSVRTLVDQAQVLLDGATALARQLTALS
jgi:hypothetical protein